MLVIFIYLYFSLWRKLLKKKRRRATWSSLKKNLNSKLQPINCFSPSVLCNLDFPDMWCRIVKVQNFAVFSTEYRRKGMNGTDWKVVLVVLNLYRAQMEDARVSFSCCVTVFYVLTLPETAPVLHTLFQSPTPFVHFCPETKFILLFCFF